MIPDIKVDEMTQPPARACTKQALALLPKARNHYNLAVSYQVQ